MCGIFCVSWFLVWKPFSGSIQSMCASNPLVQLQPYLYQNACLVSGSISVAAHERHTCGKGGYGCNVKVCRKEGQYLDLFDSESDQYGDLSDDEMVEPPYMDTWLDVPVSWWSGIHCVWLHPDGRSVFGHFDLAALCRCLFVWFAVVAWLTYIG